MTYRGVVNNGVIVIDGEKLPEGMVVDVTPVEATASGGVAESPAFGMWKDRADLPEDSAEASLELRRRAQARHHE